MKSLVVYDSVFGNTALIADKINESLGPESKIVEVKAFKTSDLEGIELLVVGSPTRAFNPTKDITDFLNKLPSSQLTGVKIAAFDTRIQEEEIKKNAFLGFMVNIFGYADKPMADKLSKKGGIKVADNMGFYVLGTEGPLKEGELERASDWAKNMRRYLE